MQGVLLRSLIWGGLKSEIMMDTIPLMKSGKRKKGDYAGWI